MLTLNAFQISSLFIAIAALIWTNGLATSKSAVPSPSLMIFVKSAVQNIRHRIILRLSLQKTLRHLGMEAKVQMKFTVARSLNSTVDKTVNREMGIFDDIIRFYYIDNYRELPRKTIGSFEYFMKTNSLPKYALLTDDDVLVNMTNLKNLMIKIEEEDHQILYLGCVLNHSLVQRNQSHRHYVSMRDYSPKYYPPYVRGAGVLMNRRAILEILSMHERYGFDFPIEDAYVGILANRVGITATHEPQFLKNEENGFLGSKWVMAHLVDEPGYFVH